MGCVDFMRPRWPLRISTLNSISVGHFALAQGNPWADIVRDSGSGNIVTNILDPGRGEKPPSRFVHAWRRFSFAG
jgi:hypothetical protein